MPPSDPLPHLDFKPSPNGNNAHLQNSTSTFVEPAAVSAPVTVNELMNVPVSVNTYEAMSAQICPEVKINKPQEVSIELGDATILRGQGRHLDNGDFEVILENGMCLKAFTEQRFPVQDAVNVEPPVAPQANAVESSLGKAYTKNVDLLAPVVEVTHDTVTDAPMEASIPWQTFPVAEVEEWIERDGVTPQAIALEVRSELLRCENLHHFTVLVADFGEAIVQWVIDTFYPNQDFSFPNLETL
jgi:hypothetical protein